MFQRKRNVINKNVFCGKIINMSDYKAAALITWRVASEIVQKLSSILFPSSTNIALLVRL